MNHTSPRSPGWNGLNGRFELDRITQNKILESHGKRITNATQLSEDALQTANEAKETAQEALQTANTALSLLNSGVDDQFVTQAATQAKELAQRALNGANGNSERIQQALETANRAVAIAQKALEAVNQMLENQRVTPEPNFGPREDLEIVDSIDGNALTPRQTVHFTSGRSVNVWNHNFPFGSSVGNWVPGNTVSVEQRDDGNGIDPYKLQNLNIDPAGKKKVNGGGCRTQ